MSAPTLSLCLIAWNEADNIGRCLKSAEAFVDEIVVVDTGSTDCTREIAKAMGAKVIQVKWQNDFSAARNVSLENATGDWILFLDCDEELDAESRHELRKAIEHGSYEAYFAMVRNTTDTNIELTFPSIRLFRNRKSFRFTGKIHEQIVNSIVANYGLQAIGHSSITIIHHGYNASTTNVAAKVQRNLEILKSYPEEKKDGFYFYNLGTEYLRLGDKKEALTSYLKALKLTKPTQAYGPILVKRTMTTLMDLHRYRDAVEQLRYYQTIFKEFSDLLLLEAVCHLNCGRYSEARARLEDYLKMPVPPAWYATENIFQGSSAEDLVERVKALALDRGCQGISVCIIGRDEEELVAYCIKSVNEIAAEVIFVDTGSTDRTPAIAYQLGASVYRFPWNDSFSEARNFAIDKAKGDWILVLDADEVLPDESRQAIVDLIRDPDHEGYFLKVRTFLDRGLSPASCYVTGACRLFRNDAYRYRGSVFGDIISPIIDAGGSTAYTEITVNHIHCFANDEYIARKRQLKIDAIKKQLRSDLTKLNFALGIEYFQAQDFISAIEHFESVRASLDEAHMAKFYYFYTLSLMKTEHYRRLAEVLDEAISMFPDYTDLIYLQAVVRFVLGETEEAKLLLHRCLEMGDAPWEKYIASPGTGGFKAMCSLGTIYSQKGDTEKALNIFLEAAGIPGAFEQAVESIVFLKEKLPVPLERFLEVRGLLNSRSLSLAAKSLAKMGRYKDSLNYLALAGERAASEPPPRDFANITQAINMLLSRFSWEVLDSLPKDSKLKNRLTV